MCFIKSPKISMPQEILQEDSVQRHTADSALTKNSARTPLQSAYVQNIKTSPVGLSEDAAVQKKTLLGE